MATIDLIQTPTRVTYRLLGWDCLEPVKRPAEDIAHDYIEYARSIGAEEYAAGQMRHVLAHPELYEFIAE
jgi:hypothetical protein